MPYSSLFAVSNRLRQLSYSLQSRLRLTKAVKLPSGGSIDFVVSTPNEVHRADTFFEKEPETLAWIDGFDRTGCVFYDVGANVGVYTTYAGKTVANITLLAFEPDGQSFGSLCRNIAINRLKGVTPYPIAIAATTGIDAMMLSSMAAGAGGAALGHDYTFLDAPAGGAFRQGIFHASLDDLVFTHGLPAPHYLKIDVDGIEREILRGAERLLAAPPLRSVLVELQYRNDAEVATTERLFAGHGFTLRQTSAWVARARDMSSRNFIFTRQ
jgi:FkbM family methyltransferase